MGKTDYELQLPGLMNRKLLRVMFRVIVLEDENELAEWEISSVM
jgi:hypothetical protein